MSRPLLSIVSLAFLKFRIMGEVYQVLVDISFCFLWVLLYSVLRSVLASPGSTSSSRPFLSSVVLFINVFFQILFCLDGY